MRALASNLFTTAAVRRIVIAVLLFIPVLTLWNLAAGSYAPSLQVRIGPPLRGVTERPQPVVWSMSAFTDGSLQRAVSAAITDAIPIRPLLIRVNNKVRRELFGQMGTPGIVAGENGNLVEEHYLTEYCSRDLDRLRARADRWIPKLKELQAFYREHGRQFLYVTTPSKVAHMPEIFVGRVPCSSSEQDRREYVARYAGMLAEAGIDFVDTASLIHGLRGRYEVDLFPAGGVHWNALGAAHAANALLAEINRLAGKPAAPRLSWTYEVTDRPSGEDTDLIDVANLLFGRPRYPTANVTFSAGKPCAEWPASNLKIAFVGGSFIHSLGRILVSEGCLRGLNSYFYLYQSVRGGPRYDKLRSDLKPADVRPPLRDADIVILEENEVGIAAMGHASEFHRLVLGK